MSSVVVRVMFLVKVLLLVVVLMVNLILLLKRKMMIMLLIFVDAMMLYIDACSCADFCYYSVVNMMNVLKKLVFDVRVAIAQEKTMKKMAPKIREIGMQLPH